MTDVTRVAPHCNFAGVCTFRSVDGMHADRLKPRGLRETKKEQTRSALSDAALALVSTHGYEATTVEAIARAAGVSVRTFHNYFPGKAAALSHLAADLVHEYGEVLRPQPDSVTCAGALRTAWGVMLDRHRENVDALRALIDALESNPDLRRYLQDHHPDAHAASIAEIARRLGIDPATSIAPRIVTEIAFTIAVNVSRALDTPEGADRGMDELLDEAFSALPLVVAAPSPDPTITPHS